jgi:hypothetical protein
MAVVKLSIAVAWAASKAAKRSPHERALMTAASLVAMVFHAGSLDNGQLGVLVGLVDRTEGLHGAL